MPSNRCAVVLAVVTLAACGTSSRHHEPVRLVADPGIRRDAPFLGWGTIVTIDGVPRTVLSASQAVVPAADVSRQPNGRRRIKATIPPEFVAIPWLVFEITGSRDGSAQMLRSWPVTGKVAGTSYDVFVPEETIGDRTPGIRLWPVPDLTTRDVETGDLAIPTGAVLEFGVGIEPATWDTTVVPVDMSVSATFGAEDTALWTLQLDVRRPEHRRWVDASVPLDGLAGRTIRLRFRARPSVGPSAVTTLPVWADPTIAPGRSPAQTP
jgi:hypothetical protein